jgi:CDP-glucose 4,6-dehydratase
MNLFLNSYHGKRVLVTGHTGFKGSWLSTWLLRMGAHVTGYSIDVPSNPSNFEVLGLANRLKHTTGNIQDLAHLERVFSRTSPEIVFHLAAQPLTRLSYDIPQETFLTNLGGTVNVLECIRRSPSVQAAVIITSDKCYKNVEWLWGYRENDMLGGDDPYSASKACAEIASHSYINSFFSDKDYPNIATARAGNVIGGGDWATDRIVPDCIKAFSKGEQIRTRNPKATRPWQHVIEPLSGYLWLGALLLKGEENTMGESFNFGPLSDVNRTVEELINTLVKEWGGNIGYVVDAETSGKKESMLLKLNCDKAFHFLGWHAVLSFEKTIQMTAQWFKAFLSGTEEMYEVTNRQLEEYATLAQEKGLEWAKETK